MASYTNTQLNNAWNNAPATCNQTNKSGDCVAKNDRHGRGMQKSRYGKSDNNAWEIHHRDGDHSNNDQNNLEAVTRDTHNEIHNN